MGKKLIITEKPSVARDFARVFNVVRKHQGYMDNDEYIITWCVGHLVEMVYPEEYDIKYKKWKLEDLPFLPAEYKYDVIKNVKDQYKLVNGFLNSKDIDIVYWAGDSGKEGQTIEENIRHFGGVRPGMTELRVWIDSQTDDEIKRGISEAKPMSDYANLGKSGVMRAIEDYALGINFSRALSVKYGTMINRAAATKSYTAIAVGRVMTCVLGMVVNREREIRNFVETPFYRVMAEFAGESFEAEWHADEKSKYFNSPALYKDNGFKEEKAAGELISYLGESKGNVESVEKSRSKKKAPFLFNLAELQAECSKLFKLSPDETLNVAQALYERKMTTYPRTDARVLTTAVAKEITKNLNGVKGFAPTASAAEKILNEGWYKTIGRSQYIDDSKVTDHYAIIPTGVVGGYSGLNDIQKKVYELIVRRFLSIFYPPAEYLQIKISVRVKTELFTASVKVLTSPGYLEVAGRGGRNGNDAKDSNDAGGDKTAGMESGNDSGNVNHAEDETTVKQATIDALSKLKKNSDITPSIYNIKPGKTSPPKRYTSGTMILAMENAGNLIDDEELRAQIKNCGIGTSATRAEIIKKLVNIGYLSLNKKTQVLTPGRIGEMIYEVVRLTEPSLLNPQMSASWEKGLDEIIRGIVDVNVYRSKLEDYIRRGTLGIAQKNLSGEILRAINENMSGQGAESAGGASGAGSTAGQRKPERRKPTAEKMSEKPAEKKPEKKTEKQSEKKISQGKTPGIGDVKCPICGGKMVKTDKGFACENYRREAGGGGCILSIGSVMGRELTENDVCELIVHGATPVIRGLTTAKGEKFDARIGFKRSEEGKITGMCILR